MRLSHDQPIVLRSLRKIDPVRRRSCVHPATSSVDSAINLMVIYPCRHVSDAVATLGLVAAGEKFSVLAFILRFGKGNSD